MAESAEAIVTSTGADLIALVTDQNLAGEMTGTELATYARDRHPHLSIVVMSGSTVTSLPKDTVFLQKPFFAEQAARRDQTELVALGPRIDNSSIDRHAVRPKTSFIGDEVAFAPV
jgi:hypothetical protein